MLAAATHSPRTGPHALKEWFQTTWHKTSRSIAELAAELTVGKRVPLAAIDWVLEAIPYASLNPSMTTAPRVRLLRSAESILLHGRTLQICLKSPYTIMRYLARRCMLLAIEADDRRLLGTVAVVLPAHGRNAAPVVVEITGVANAPLSAEIEAGVRRDVEVIFGPNRVPADWWPVVRRCRRLERKLRQGANEVIVAGRWLDGEERVVQEPPR